MEQEEFNKLFDRVTMLESWKMQYEHKSKGPQAIADQLERIADALESITGKTWDEEAFIKVRGLD